MSKENKSLQICGRKYKKHPFLVSDFKPIKLENILVNLSKDIKILEKERGIVIDYIKENNIRENRDYIIGFLIDSMDGILKGKVTHKESSGYLEVNGSITAEIDVKPDQESSKESYLNLNDLLYSKGFRNRI